MAEFRVFLQFKLLKLNFPLMTHTAMLLNWQILKLQICAATKRCLSSSLYFTTVEKKYSGERLRYFKRLAFWLTEWHRRLVQEHQDASTTATWDTRLAQAGLVALPLNPSIFPCWSSSEVRLLVPSSNWKAKYEGGEGIYALSYCSQSPELTELGQILLRGLLCLMPRVSFELRQRHKALIC